MWLLRKFADLRKRSDKIEDALLLTKPVDTFATVGIVPIISEDAQEPWNGVIYILLMIGKTNICREHKRIMLNESAFRSLPVPTRSSKIPIHLTCAGTSRTGEVCHNWSKCINVFLENGDVRDAILLTPMQ